MEVYQILGGFIEAICAYPHKAVVEMHSNEASSNAKIPGHSFIYSLSHNCLR